jgi:CheY-like chemotaxis protein
MIKNITPDYSIELASNGKEALEKITASQPALIITENEMPVMNGLDFVKELIKTEFINTLPVIVLSSKIDRQTMLLYADLGIEHVFLKPVNIKSFKEAVERSIRKGITKNILVT